MARVGSALLSYKLLLAAAHMEFPYERATEPLLAAAHMEIPYERAAEPLLAAAHLEFPYEWGPGHLLAAAHLEIPYERVSRYCGPCMGPGGFPVRPYENFI